MGCVYAKNPNEIKNISNGVGDIPKDKVYSWDLKEKVNPKDFIIEDVKNDTVGKLPGSINGQQFIIQNCQNSNIYVFDWINTITVDDCYMCNIFIGPTKGSVFLRDCKDCNVILASQQFRARDCKRMNIFVCCTTQPSIESCSGMKFGCFRYNYNGLEGQFLSSGLTPFNNNWSVIHDFTPGEGEKNYEFLKQDVKIEDFIPIPSKEEFTALEVNVNPRSSYVPQTLGRLKKSSKESCLVVFFPDGQTQERAMFFVKEQHSSSNFLVRTKEVLMDKSDTERVFGTDAYNNVVKRGAVIALEYNGDEATNNCQNMAKSIALETGSTGLVYVSSNSKSATTQIEQFFTYADIQMSV